MQPASDSSIAVEAIAYVRSPRLTPTDDYWGGTQAEITLTDRWRPEALLGLEAFSHIEVVFHFHRVRSQEVLTGARHPRDNPRWPMAGVFAQRARARPNRIGVTICRLLQRRDRTLVVSELDAIDGTPVLDIKPVLREFLPREPTMQPPWATELMTRYWEDHRHST